MFSTEAAVQSARSSLRNPRRRQRTSEGVKEQPRRKRSKLADDSSVGQDESHINGNGSTLMNGHAVQSSAENSLVLVDMPVREKKASQKRATKEDNAHYLTKNASYSLKKLPSFPSALLRPSTPFRGFALSSAGLALALTHDRALVWDYHAAVGPPKTLSLSLPFGLRATDPLPLGGIVRNGPTNDFGVVAVAPSSGKIAFWENIDNAEAHNLYQQRRQAVEGSVKIHSGETITEVVDVEHAGFVLVFSSGRLAHLTLRDPQGRPGISAVVLNTPNSSNGSFFSFKSLLGGAVRKTIAAVRSRPSDVKGQMEVISATRDGTFQHWDMNWSGQHNFVREVDVHDEIASAVRSESTPETRNQQEIQILDFAIMEKRHSSDIASLLLLVSVSDRESLGYSLVEVDLSQTNGTVSRAIRIRNFQQAQIPKDIVGTLLLPSPGHTAFVVFPGAICVASLSEPEESPDNQLLMDSGRLKLPYQDTIYLRNDIDVVVSGNTLEQSSRKDKRANAIFFIQQFGTVQITATSPSTDDQDEERQKVTARSKLEQATIFSVDPNNILDFSIKSRFTFSAEEIAQAALDISSDVLGSSLEYFEKVTSSMDEQFQKRALVLQNLMTHLRSDYPALSYQTKWRLLWHAEKLAAAHKLWNWYQDKLQDQQTHPEAYIEDILMSDLIKAVNERYKTPVQTELGETDAIRQFFLKDVDSLHVLIPWGWFYLRQFYLKDGAKEQPAVMQRLSEGTDVMLIALETAFEFRQANVESYELDADLLDDGVLKPGHGYDLLPHFWTSSHNIVSSIRSLVDVGRNRAVANFEEGDLEYLAQKIGKDNPRLVKVGCQTHIERFQWALEQDDQKQRDMGTSLKAEWDTNVRPAHILGLMEIGLATDGMVFAEEYRDMPTLVNLIWEETNWLENEKASSRSKMEQAESTVKLNRIKERISRYFDEFGDSWADAFYSKYIHENQAAQLFAKEYLNQAALTKFLRADPSRARLRWVNEVHGEKNFEAAAASLYDAAKQETNAWCQRVELSISKLAMLCQKEIKEGDQPLTYADPAREKTRAERTRDKQFASTSQQLEYTKVQEAVYEHLQDIITSALDDDSAVQLLMSESGQGRLNDRPAHQAVLKEGFECLVHHRTMEAPLMIDILTLMNFDDKEEITSLLQTNEFIFALQVLYFNFADIHRTTRDGLHKLLWKRLLIKDDWAQINQTKDMSDANLHEFLVHTNLGWTFRGLFGLMEQDPGYKVVFPRQIDDLLGAGATHGELCVRFPVEDLRAPIIKDNLMDDDLLREHIEKHRLTEWMHAAYQAGKKAHHMQKTEAAGLANGTLSREVEDLNDEEDINVAESVELPGSDSFEGDTESVADQEHDVEMQDS